MLYIEDYLELIEPFPQEIRERLTEMREIDLHIHNEMDKLDSRVQGFFQQCKKQKTEWKNENFEDIKKEYLKLLENADEKCQIVNQLYELIEKYLKKLDQELQKFKLELEADHAGITSKLEQVICSKIPSLNENSQSNHPATTTTSNANLFTNLNINNNNNTFTDESDFTLNPSLSTNELVMMMMQTTNSSSNLALLSNDLNTNNAPLGHKRKHSSVSDKNVREDEDSSSSWNSKLEFANSNSTFTFLNTINNNNNKRNSISLNKKPTLPTTTTTTNKQNETLLNLIKSNSLLSGNSSNSSSSNAGGSGRRASATISSKFKATKLEKQTRAIKKPKMVNDYEFDEDENDSVRNNEMDEDYEDLNEGSEAATSENENLIGSSRNVNNNDDDYELDSSEENDADNVYNEDTNSDDLRLSSNKRRAANSRNFKEDWNSGEDTNERRYCICKDVSYGEMVMCDNLRCERQWFHFNCMGLSSAPRGKWYCPSCIEMKKKRKEKHLNTILNTISAYSTQIASSQNSTSTNNSTPTSSSSTTTTTIHSSSPFLTNKSLISNDVLNNQPASTTTNLNNFLSSSSSFSTSQFK